MNKLTDLIFCCAEFINILCCVSAKLNLMPPDTESMTLRDRVDEEQLNLATVRKGQTLKLIEDCSQFMQSSNN